jgi:hypothetical protein
MAALPPARFRPLTLEAAAEKIAARLHRVAVATLPGDAKRFDV